MELNKEFFDWIEKHKNDDPAKLRLKMHGKLIAGIDASVAILQIECRRKYASKFAHTLAMDPYFYFPGKINAEQATSDRLAQYHRSLAAGCPRVADLTSGLGIDIMHLASDCSAALAIEKQPDVADALKFNAENSGISNMEVLCADCCGWLSEAPADSYDCLFIDPARRATDGSRVFALADCMPDITTMQTRMLEVAPRFIAKLSPMLDISHIAGEINSVCRIISLGTTTECKELLVVASSGFKGEPQIEAVTLTSDNLQSTISFKVTDELGAKVTYGMPQPGDYIFEPWPSVMKAAPVRLLAELYNLKKIAPNTHMYFSTTNDAANGFPGNCMRIIDVLPYSSSVIKRFARHWPKASVTARNFGVAADAVSRKLGVRDGGDVRVFAVSDAQNQRYLIVAS